MGWMLALVVLTAVWDWPAFGMPGACIACHFESRSLTSGRFENGFGRWTDDQCFGCHQEFNEIGRLFAEGIKDKRYYGLPIRDERLLSLAKNPLPYGSAPLHLRWEKYDPDRLLRFLQRPAGHPARMPAFPDLNAAELAFVKTSSVQGDAARGKLLFEKSCRSCHGPRESPSGRSALQLTMMSSEWIYRYANGETGNMSRRMPVLKVTAEDAADLFSYLGKTWQQAEEELERSVKSIGVPRKTDKVASPALVAYMEQRFFRDGGCIHCHGIKGRAQDKFDTSPDGLKIWLGKRDPFELWRRLEIRAYEEKLGIGAKTPGMPMTGPALPEPMRAIMLTWIQSSCPQSSGAFLCETRDNKKPSASGDDEIADGPIRTL